jgi:integrase
LVDADSLQSIGVPQKAIFAAAVGSGSLEMTPAGVLQAPALGLKKTPRGRKLDADELKALFEALDLNAILDGTATPQKLSETVRLGIALLYYAPVRSHSLVAAEWKEIDLDVARWRIPVSKLKLHREDRAEARPFVVPLPGTAIAILRRLRALAGDNPFVLASPLPSVKPKTPPRHVAPKVLVRALARLQESGRLELGRGSLSMTPVVPGARGRASFAYPSRSRRSPSRTCYPALRQPTLTRTESRSAPRRPNSSRPRSTESGSARRPM